MLGTDDSAQLNSIEYNLIGNTLLEGPITAMSEIIDELMVNLPELLLVKASFHPDPAVGCSTPCDSPMLMFRFFIRYLNSRLGSAPSLV